MGKNSPTLATQKGSLLSHSIQKDYYWGNCALNGLHLSEFFNQWICLFNAVVSI